jgi:hypothetical protein
LSLHETNFDRETKIFEALLEPLRGVLIVVAAGFTK